MMTARLLRRLRALRELPELRASALFDAAWYLDHAPDLRAAGVRDAVWHYLTHGAAEGRDPGPRFSTSGHWLQGGRRDENALLAHLRGAGKFAALPIFRGTGPIFAGDAPVILFCAHQAQGMQFGAERSFLTMLARARHAGLTVEVVLPHCLDPAYLAACRTQARAVRLIPYGWRRAGRVPHPETRAALVQAIRDSGACAVHLNTLVCDAPALAAQDAGVPSVVYLREVPPQDAELCARMDLTPDILRDELLSTATRFVANGPVTAAWIDPDAQMGPDRLVILPNTVDLGLFDEPFAPTGRLRVGLIGSTIAKKGIADARAVALGALEAGLDLEVVLIGPATPDLTALGTLPANMRHAGYSATPREAVRQTDIVLSLSHFAESYGRTIPEAMAAGRPVIVYDRGTPPQLVGPGAGQIVPADDPQAVVLALARWTKDRDALARASHAARACARALQDKAKAVSDALLFREAFPTSAPRK
ncbi:MAG: glycosyltransferase family 4 protein [Roseinatronobacter sp.]